MASDNNDYKGPRKACHLQPEDQEKGGPVNEKRLTRPDLALPPGEHQKKAIACWSSPSTSLERVQPCVPSPRRPVVTAHVSSLGRTLGTELSVISCHQGGQEEEGQQFQMLKEENGQPRILYPLKRAFRNTSEVKTFSDEEKRIEFVTSRPALPAQLTKGFQTKRK